MRIDSYLPLISIYNTISRPAGQDTTKQAASKKLQESQTVSSVSTGQSSNKPVSLEADAEIDLGSIDGKPVKMTIFSQGGYRWNGNPGISGPIQAGQPVTKEQKWAARAVEAYSKTEHEWAGRVLSTVNDLYLITGRGYSTKFFNKATQQQGISQGDIEDALKRLGINPSEPFTINGRSFSLANGKLSEIKK